MSRIAIFSDVHGNLPALQTVLKDIDSKNIDQVYCLGDLVDFAPWPNEVITVIRNLRIPCLMGNHDERIAFNHEVIPLKKHSPEETIARIAAISSTKKTVSSVNKAYLANLPRHISLTFELNGEVVRVLLVHASTQSNDEYIYEDHELEGLKRMMDEHQADVLVMGHTHESYIRNILAENQKLALNCGSVGRSKEAERLATYLILDINNEGINPEIVKLQYPVEETIKAIRQSEIPDFYAGFLMG